MEAGGIRRRAAAGDRPGLARHARERHLYEVHPDRGGVVCVDLLPYDAAGFQSARV